MASFRILGPIEVMDGERCLEVGGRRQLALLAFLLVHANKAVSTDAITDAIWGPSRSGADNRLQMAITRLRRALEPLNRNGEPLLRTVSGGYLLSVGPGALDTEVFGSQVQQGRRALDAGEAARAAELLGQALGLWRGPPLAEVAFEDFALPETRRLEELRLVAIEARVDAELELGRHTELVGELEALVAEHPTREHVAAQLMLALYRSGRQAEALEVYQRTRARLFEELGLDPGPALKALQAEILAQMPSLEAPPAATVPAELPLPSPPVSSRQHRKSVTVLFVDLVESTALGERLDPEALRGLMVRYFAVLRSAIEAHGGSVSKFIGDAVVAIFGVPAAHEDDALRAVRAALEARQRLTELNRELEGGLGVRLETRSAINTGEVVVGDRADGEEFVVGDPLNVAARLEQGAAVGEILLGSLTYDIVRDAVRAERSEPVELKGKAQPLVAYRLLELVGDSRPQRRHRAPLVGRGQELRLIQDAFERTCRERSLHLFTVLGPAGVGKSRLVEEAARSWEQCTVVSGRCLPYGDGITFWPLTEILRSVASIVETDSADEAERKLAQLGDGADGAEGAATVAAILAGLIGIRDAAAQIDEGFWAVRRLFESLARRTPLIVVFEDVHWAEPTLLDLIEHVVEMTRDAPILIVCVARADLLDSRPGWGGGKRNAASVHLEPLTPQESTELIDALLGGAPLPAAASARIADGSEGFPLFVEEMVAMLIDDGLIRKDRGGWKAAVELEKVAVPPTIRALLAARLDGLPEGERRMLELASVIGQEFSAGEIAAIAPLELEEASRRLFEALVRKDLIVPERAAVTGDDAFRFRHILIRDAAYESLPKAERAELHERYARWLDEAPVDVAEVDEIAGWHLEQVVCNQREVQGVVDAAIARRAAERLYAAGRRAGDRGDVLAATKLLDRALEVGSHAEQLVADAAVELAGRLIELSELARADELLTTLERGEDAGGKAALCRLEWLVLSHPEVASETIEAQLPAMLDELARVNDDRGIARARMLAFWVNWGANQAVAAAEQVRQAAEHATLAGDVGLRSRALGWYVATLIYGPVPVAAMATELDAVEREQAGPYSAACVDLGRGVVDRLRGRLAEARLVTQRAIDSFAELGLRTLAGASTQLLAQIELAAGELGTARDELLLGDEALAELGDSYFRSTTQAMLAHVYALSGDGDSARGTLHLAEHLSAPGDAVNFAMTHEVRAQLALASGECESAERWARSAVHQAEYTDWVGVQADAQLGLARVLGACGRRDEAARVARAALKLFDQKGDRPGIRVARDLIDELRMPA